MFPRIIIHAHDGTFMGELLPAQCIGVTVTSEVNGEHSMTVRTMQELAKNDRLLWRDGMGDWHEFVVESDDASREYGRVTHEYWCPWSVQHDLSQTVVTGMPGTGGTPATATEALTAALAGTARWGVGTVEPTATGSASFWRLSGWEAMAELVKVWGGEVRATITVGTGGVAARQVDLLEHVGTSTATRRFDYGGDLSGIRRILSDQPWTCRVMPLGAAQETASGGYGRKITVEDVAGVDYVEDADMVAYCRVPVSAGVWEYPTQVVENPDAKTPAELYDWALAHLREWTTPKVSYEADVVQLARAGMDAHGVALGDEVLVVDRAFGSAPLRVAGRVLRIEEDLLEPSNTVVTVSNLADTLANTLDALARSTAQVGDMVTGMSANQSTSAYVQSLLDRLNATANATGGWTYITQGEGIRTYDAPVSDPLVGDEASAVVEVKGGTIRIASSRTPSGDWEWLTVFTSGHVAAEAVTALNVTAGFISGINGTYIDLESGLVVLGDESGFHMRIDETELGFYQGTTRVAYLSNEMLYIPLAVGINALQVGGEGSVSWQWKLRDNGNFQLKWMGKGE